MKTIIKTSGATGVKLAIQVLTSMTTIGNYPIKHRAPEANKLLAVLVVVMMKQAAGRRDIAIVMRATRETVTQRRMEAASVQRG